MLDAVPGVTLEQPRSRVDEEREEHEVGLGEVQCALYCVPGGARVAERLARDRLQQSSCHYPHRMGSDGAVQYGREHSRRALRIVLGQPQQRDDVTHLAALALVSVQLCDGAFDLPRFAEQDEGLQRVRPHRPGEGMRRDQHLGQLPCGPEGRDRVGVTTASQFEAPAGVVEMHPDGRLDCR